MQSAGRGLATLLNELKQRSGLSYSALAARSFTSSSALHRWCRGAGAPPDWSTALRIAESCGARPEELTRLLRLWRRATGSGPVGDDPVDEPSMLGPVAWWERAGRPVEPAGFGVTVNSASGRMPSFRVGSVRLWDSETRWAQLEPRPGQFDWTVLDRLVDGAERAGLPVLFVFGGTPGWAAPQGPKGPYEDGSRTAPPEDWAHWERFTRAVGTRYRGRIAAYELWVYGNDRRYWSAGPEQLAELARRGARVLREADPEAQLVAPSMGGLWEVSGHRAMERFAALDGYQVCDVAGVKLHQHHAADPPETMARLLGALDATLHRAGVHPPIWSTGTTHELPLQGRLEPERARDYAVRFFLTGLYGREIGLRRMYFYSWGGWRLPVVLEAEGLPPTPAAEGVARLQQWLAGTLLRAAGHGEAAGLPDGVWQIRVDRPDGSPATIRWTEHGHADTGLPPGARVLRRLDGTSEPAPQSGGLQVSETPVLVEC